MLRTLLLILLLASSAPALAIYKCESNGKVTYSDSSCPGGKIMELPDTASERISPADAAKAKQQTAREKADAAHLAKERHQREASEQRQQQQAFKAAAARKKNCTTLAQRKKWAEEDAAGASAKSTEKARRNARRIAEKYEAQCKIS
jgi:hypothetical protein